MTSSAKTWRLSPETGRSDRHPSLLFLARKFPPSVGGMQNYLYQLRQQLDRRHRLRTIALGRSQRHLAWFLPWCLAAGLAAGWRRGVTHVLAGDALLAPIGLLVARAAEARATITTYGLDVIYPKGWYQSMIGTFLPRYDRVVCISRATRDACVERGVDERICDVVPPGVEHRRGERADRREEVREHLRRRVPFPVRGEPLLLALGRHVRRKGFAWFVEHVVPMLPVSATLVLAGEGPERERVAAAAERAGVADRVRLPGLVDDDVKSMLFRAADVFVMPNRRVPGDMEGFGLVALEASAVGTPVVAAGIEGIRDAVVPGETGLLVREGDATSFAEGIRAASRLDRESVKAATESRYSWEKTYRGYARTLGLTPEGSCRA